MSPILVCVIYLLPLVIHSRPHAQHGNQNSTLSVISYQLLGSKNATNGDVRNDDQLDDQDDTDDEVYYDDHVGSKRGVTDESHDDVHNNSHVDNRNDVNSDTHSNIKSDTHSDVFNDTHSDVHNGVHGDIMSDTNSDVHNDTHSDVHSDTHSDIYSDTHTDAHNDTHGDVHNDTHNDIHNDTHSYVDSDTHSYVYEITQSDIHDDTHSDVHNDTHSDVYNDTHSYVHEITQSDTHNDTHSDVHNDTQSYIHETTQNDIHNDTDSDVHNDTHSDVYSDSHTDVHNDTHSDVHNDTHSYVDSDTHSDVHNDTHNDIHNDTHNDVHNDTHSYVHSDTHSDVHNDTHSDVHIDTHSDVHNDTHIDVHSDVYSDTHSDVHSDTHTDVHNDTHSDIHNDIHSDIHNDTHSYVHEYTQSDIHNDTHNDFHSSAHNDAHDDIHSDAHSDIYNDTYTDVHMDTHTDVHNDTHVHIRNATLGEINNDTPVDVHNYTHTDDTHGNIDSNTHTDDTHGDDTENDSYSNVHSGTYTNVHNDTHPDDTHGHVHSDTVADDTHGDVHSDTENDNYSDVHNSTYTNVHNDTHPDDTHGDVHNDTENDNYSDVHSYNENNNYSGVHNGTYANVHNDTHGDVHSDTVADDTHGDVHSDTVADDTHGDVHSDTVADDTHGDVHSDTVADDTHGDVHSDTVADDTHGDVHSDTVADDTHGDVHSDTTTIAYNDTQDDAHTTTVSMLRITHSVTNQSTNQPNEPPFSEQPFNQTTNETTAALAQQKTQYTRLLNNTIAPAFSLPSSNGSTTVLDFREDSRDLWKISLGVVIPLVLFAVVLVGVYLCYRRKYPVRMVIGRDFGKFTNPDYVRPVHSPALVREDADLYFSTRSSATLTPDELNPVIVGAMYDNLGFSRDEEDVDDEEEQERTFREKKNWLFRKTLEEPEEIPDTVTNSSMAQKHQGKGATEHDVKRKERGRFRDAKDLLKERKSYKKNSGIWKKRRLERTAKKYSSLHDGQTKETNIDSVTGVSNDNKDEITLESESNISKYSKTVSIDNTLQTNENESQFNNKSSSGRCVKSSAILFEQPTFEEVWAMVKAKSRSLSADSSPSSFAPRGFNVNPAKSARKMSLQVESALSPHPRSSADLGTSGSHSNKPSSRDDAHISVRQELLSPLVPTNENSENLSKEIKPRRMSPESISVNLDTVLDVDEKNEVHSGPVEGANDISEKNEGHNTSDPVGGANDISEKNEEHNTSDPVGGANDISEKNEGHNTSGPMGGANDISEKNEGHSTSGPVGGVNGRSENVSVVRSETVQEHISQAISTADQGQNHPNNDFRQTSCARMATSGTQIQPGHPSQATSDYHQDKIKSPTTGTDNTDTSKSAHRASATEEHTKSISTLNEVSAPCTSSSSTSSNMATGSVSDLPNLKTAEMKNGENRSERQSSLLSDSEFGKEQSKPIASSLSRGHEKVLASTDNHEGKTDTTTNRNADIGAVNKHRNQSDNSNSAAKDLPTTACPHSSRTNNSSKPVDSNEVATGKEKSSLHNKETISDSPSPISHADYAIASERSEVTIKNKQKEALTGLPSHNIPIKNTCDKSSDFAGYIDEDDDNGLKVTDSDISEVLDCGSDENEDKKRDAEEDQEKSKGVEGCVTLRLRESDNEDDDADV